VTFGRRLALFFLLIVLVPTLGLVAVVVIVSEDSRKGKADARLAAGLDTATGLYSERVEVAQPDARALARDPALAEAIVADDGTALQAFADAAVASPDLEGIEVLGPGGEQLASAGKPDAMAFAEIRLAQGGEASGTLRVSSTLAQAYVDEVRQLTKREGVVSRNGGVIASTVTPPQVTIQPGETLDVEAGDSDYRAHLETLDSDDGETLLLLGPRKEGGFLAVGRPAALVLIGFLMMAGVFGYTLTRALARLHAQVEEQAATDPLTGLFNRRRMWDQLSREVERANRFQHPLSLLIFDIDDFKAINDEHGHLQGDDVLQAIGGTATDVARSIDFAARYGGDELALILIETDADGAATFAERLRSSVPEKEIPLRDGGSMKVTVSVGAATVPDAATDVDSLVHAADTALREAKRAGKNQIRSAPGDRTAKAT
jgi:diguanylate cyclase (GGDEF)-like protein